MRPPLRAALAALCLALAATAAPAQAPEDPAAAPALAPEDPAAAPALAPHVAVSKAPQGAARVLPPSPHLVLDGGPPVPGFVDAAAPCLPGADRAELEAPRAQAQAGDWLAARQLLRSVRGAALEPESAAAREAALLGAVLALRPDPSPAHRRALEAALRDGGARASVACAHLELARAQLLAGLAPEAGVSALRALGGGTPEELPTAQADAFHALRAEALFLSDRVEAARPHYDALRQSGEPRLAAAADLRLALLPLPADAEPVTARERYLALKALHDRAQEQHLDVDPWAALLGELALEADLADAAHVWFALAQERAGADSPEVIRRADALVLAERPDEARLLLQHLIERRGRDPLGTLASVRLVDLGLWTDGEASRRERLQVASRHLHPRVAAVALDVLAHELQRAGELDAALAARARLLREDVPAGLVRHTATDLAPLLARAGAADAACEDVVRRLGSTRDVFIAHTPDPEPLLRLGDCYLEYGMAEPALSVYRSLARSFGTEVTGQLPYRLARASLASGDLPAVAAAVRSALAAADRPDRARWLLLRARLELAAGDPAAAATSLLACLAAPGLPPASRREAVLALSRVGREAPEPWQSVAASALAHEPLWPPHAAEQRGELALHLADANPTGPRARAWYQMAIALLPEGSMRDRALFRTAGRRGSATRRSDTGDTAGVVDESTESYWGRVLEVDARIERVASRLGATRAEALR